MNPFRRGGTLMLATAWLLILGGLYWYFSAREARESNPNQARVLSGQQGEVILLRNGAGHYVAEGDINGRRVTFLLDTGATRVALPLALGMELGLKRGAAITLQTANGPAVAYQTRLASVRIGAIELNDVGAVMSEGLEAGIVLLGMSFLNRMEMRRDGSTMTLTKRY